MYKGYVYENFIDIMEDFDQTKIDLMAYTKKIDLEEINKYNLPVCTFGTPVKIKNALKSKNSDIYILVSGKTILSSIVDKNEKIEPFEKILNLEEFKIYRKFLDKELVTLDEEIEKEVNSWKFL